MNPLTSDLFGVPRNNYFGWLVVMFNYSGFSRLFSKWKLKVLTLLTATGRGFTVYGFNKNGFPFTGQRYRLFL
jgi:hypothetical protein